MASQVARGDSVLGTAAGSLSPDGGERLLDLQCVFDLSRDLMRVSTSCTRILGYQPQKPIDRSFLDLEESNRELDASSCSVSHDLRESLRAIAGFTGLLRDQHYETIEADSRRCINRVLAGTPRMSNLIDDLLQLGRATVQRIVQRHGGRIWADAAVDREATIYFTIAKG